MIFLYIDPGTGSMLFSVLIGVAAALIYFVRGLIIKLKFRAGSGGAVRESEKHPYVIYSDSKRYWNVFGPILAVFEARGIDVEYWTQSEDDPAFEQEWTHVHPTFIGEGNKGFVRLNMMRAGIVLSTTPGLDVLQWKRSKDVDCYVHIRHAVDTALGYRMFGMDFYDMLLLPAQFQVEEYRTVAAMRGLPEQEIEVVGQPYLDGLAEKLLKAEQQRSTEEDGSQENQQAAAGAGASQADQTEARGKEAPVVLVAPSWGPSSILCKYGAAFLDALLATGYEVIVRPHPQSYTADADILSPLMEQYQANDQLSWNRDNDNFDVLHRADLMITDFSGVIFDFTLVFDKPILYADTSFDHAPYDSAWYEGSLWKFDVLPTLGRELKEADFPRMKEMIDEVIASEDFAAGRREARETAWQHRGEAAERVVDALERKLRALREKADRPSDQAGNKEPQNVQKSGKQHLRTSKNGLQEATKDAIM